MHISPELSIVEHNNAERARIAQAMEVFLQSGGEIQEVSGFVPYKPVSYNNEVIPPSLRANKAVNIQKSSKATEFEREIAEKLKGYGEMGLLAASKELGLGVRRLAFIASNYGIKFSQDPLKKKSMPCDQWRIETANKREEHVAKIAELAKTMCYREAMKATGISYSALYKASVEGEFKFQPDEEFVRFGGKSPKANPSEDRKLFERLSALSAAGISLRQSAKQVGISTSVIRRIMNVYGLTYPARSK